jgi:hypothetical protein
MSQLHRTRRRNSIRHNAGGRVRRGSHKHPELGLEAYRAPNGRWYFIGVAPGDEELYDYQVRELVPLPRLAG